jgi:hypothetical protein
MKDATFAGEAVNLEVLGRSMAVRATAATPERAKVHAV